MKIQRHSFVINSSERWGPDGLWCKSEEVEPLEKKLAEKEEAKPMKTTLTFEVDSGDVFEELKLRRLMTTDSVYSVMWDLDQKLRGYIKHGIPEEKNNEEGLVSILEELRYIIREGVDFDIYP
jgi:hypothetical protein